MICLTVSRLYHFPERRLTKSICNAYLIMETAAKYSPGSQSPTIRWRVRALYNIKCLFYSIYSQNETFKILFCKSRKLFHNRILTTEQPRNAKISHKNMIHLVIYKNERFKILFVKAPISMRLFKNKVLIIQGS